MQIIYIESPFKKNKNKTPNKRDWLGMTIAVHTLAGIRVTHD